LLGRQNHKPLGGPGCFSAVHKVCGRDSYPKAKKPKRHKKQHAKKHKKKATGKKAGKVRKGGSR
jgi:hypothetical protein